MLSRTDDQVAVSPALIEERRLSRETLVDFHLHGDPATLPLSSVLVFPASAKAGTLLRAEVDRRPDVQVLAPRKVIEDLLAFVLQVKAIFDRLSGVLLLSTGLFSALVLLLSARLRADEFRTLHAIGCGRGAVLQLVLLELAGLVAAAAALAAALAWTVLHLLPDLIQTL